MTDRTTALIVGAGPAGCAAAIQLARSDIDVVLIEAAQFPRHRPGETLHPGVEALFEQLGVAEQVNAANFLRHRGHHIQWQLEEPERFETFGNDERGEWLGYQAWRPELDEILLQAAQENGARVLMPRRAIDYQNGTVSFDGGKIEAKYVLDGTGRHHWLSRRMDISWKTSSPKLIARFGYVDERNLSEFETPKLSRDEEGWTWIAQVQEQSIAWVRLRLDGKDPGPSWVPSQLEDAQQNTKTKGADVTWRIAEQVSGPGWFLLGDAAMVLDPLSSHGVLRALMSGIQAAHLVTAVEKGTATSDQASEYYRGWLREWYEKDVSRMREFYHGHV